MAELFARDTIKNLRKLRHLKPDLFKGFMDFDQAVFKDGALPAKTKELMAVTAAHVTQCRGVSRRTSSARRSRVRTMRKSRKRHSSR